MANLGGLDGDLGILAAVRAGRVWAKGTAVRVYLVQAVIHVDDDGRCRVKPATYPVTRSTWRAVCGVVRLLDEMGVDR